MWPTSDLFDLALTRHRTIATSVEVLQGGQTVTALDVVVEGTVTAEDTSIRRSGSIRLKDPHGTLTPVTANDLLAPRGAELRIRKGLYLPGQQMPELVPLATLRISNPNIRRDESGMVIDVKGYDRARAIKRARFRAPWQIPKGTLATQAISDIITSRSNYPVNITPSSATTPELVFEQLSDPWDAILQIATAISYEVFFDVLGTFVARPVPNYEAQEPVWVYEPGPASLLLYSARDLDDAESYSGVIVTSEHPDNPDPIRVEVWDTDPNSPTYYDPAHPELSTFGPVPFGFSSPIITTAAQATLAGQTIGQRVFGLTEHVDIDCIGHFGHDVGDVIRVTDPRTRLAGSHIISQVVQPIRRGPMKLTMRARRAVQL